MSSLNIAGVFFHVSSPDCEIRNGALPAYRNFISAVPAQGDLVIDLQLSAGDMPSLHAMQQLFDSGESWLLHAKEDEFFLSLTHADAGHFWSARFRKECERVDINCGEELIKRDKKGCVIMSPVNYPLDQILMIYRLSGGHGVIIHAAGAETGGNCFLFAGRSGAGKSTISRILDTAGMRMLSDDRMVVRKKAETFRAFGTPWPGDAGFAVNASAPVGGICFLNHDAENRKTPLEPKEAFKRLMPVTSIMWYDPEMVAAALDFCEQLVLAVPSYELSFTPDIAPERLLEVILHE